MVSDLVPEFSDQASPISEKWSRVLPTRCGWLSKMTSTSKPVDFVPVNLKAVILLSNKKCRGQHKRR